MRSTIRGYTCLGLMLVGLAASFQASAEYKYTSVDYPGAVLTQLWGINNSGQAVGVAQFVLFGPSFPFTYDTKSGTFTPLPLVPGAVDTVYIGINERGTAVGSAFDGTSDSGLILDKATQTVFTHPAWPYTQARAVGSSGKVTGFAPDNFGSSIGFIYDPKDGSFVDITFPNARFIIAQGINGRGDVVGSAVFPPNGVFPGSAPGNYGFLRYKNGSTALFRINNEQTRARGLSDSGRMTGFISDPNTGTVQGFVGDLALQPGYQALTAPPIELLDVPGAVETFPQAISGSGLIVGFWDDGVAIHAFVATPLPGGKK